MNLSAKPAPPVSPAHSIRRLSAGAEITPYKVEIHPICGGSRVPADCGGMVSPRQIRAARALLGWSQQDLADAAIVSVNALARLENGKVDSRVSTLQSIEKALKKAGIEFLSVDKKGEGVRLLDPEA
ncbi:MAG TPA: helix-turn-helix transcriptional regulator [Mesorhizobium sp.]|uniref:helix-turn-helix transcriptional regulator n=1 Tax=Mesorhizobium sp. TaxID=1871066 RepID=UPI002DDCAF1A|nr:helix-turn-helix transcriptional regulator [Mesorhizobium sp.]HEV2503718.1 helix-turn-helix transcriptional regulator [Mesorhizobium sp.]